MVVNPLETKVRQTTNCIFLHILLKHFKSVCLIMQTWTRAVLTAWPVGSVWELIRHLCSLPAWPHYEFQESRDEEGKAPHPAPDGPSLHPVRTARPSAPLWWPLHEPLGEGDHWPLWEDDGEFCTVCPRYGRMFQFASATTEIGPQRNATVKVFLHWMNKVKCLDHDSSRSCRSEIFGHVLPLRLLFEYFACH